MPITTRFREAVDQAQRIVLLTHVGPDGDALGSLTAMGQALLAWGKEVTLVCDSPMPPRFSFLALSDAVQNRIDSQAQFDLLIALDCGDESRMGNPYKKLRTKPPIINIDHHVTNTNFGDINWVKKATSTTEMLYQLFTDLDLDLTQPIATSLLTGLVTDTIGFRTPNVTADTLKISGALMDAGADLTEITMKTLNLKQMPTLRLWQIGLDHMQLEDGLIWTTISRDERAASGHRGDSSNGLVNFLADVDKAAIGVVLMEMNDETVRVGFRCRPPYDVAGLATKLGGGGHPQAAGCTLDGPLAKAEALIVEECKSLILVQTPPDNGRY